MENVYLFCFIIFVCSEVFSVNQSSKTLKAIQQNKKLRTKRSDGGNLPPLPMLSSNQRPDEYQEIPYFVAETRQYNVGPQANIPNNQLPLNRSRTSVTTNRTTYNYQQSSSRGQTNNSNSNARNPYYNTRTDRRYGQRRYPQYTTPGSNTQDNTRIYSTSGYSGPRYSTEQNPQRVYTTDDMRYTSGYQYVYRPNNRRPVYTQRRRMSNDPNCPIENHRVVLINNLGCRQAVNSIGHFICYQYERVSRECCQECLAVKQPHKRGCEYGDRSYQCRNIEAFDCYDQRTRDICCDRCLTLSTQTRTGIASCEYGDLTPRCTIVNRKRHLCYLPENQRLCCVTCPRLADQSNANCRWGDQNPQLCAPYTPNRTLRINCYMDSVQQVCCNSCKRLRERHADSPPGCEFGDRPVSFSTSRGILDCGGYVSRFGIEVCANSDVNMHCCYTCHRYRTMTTGG